VDLSLSLSLSLSLPPSLCQVIAAVAIIIARTISISRARTILIIRAARCAANPGDKLSSAISVIHLLPVGRIVVHGTHGTT